MWNMYKTTVELYLKNPVIEITTYSSEGPE